MAQLNTTPTNKHSIWWWGAAGLTAAVLTLIVTVLIGTVSQTPLGLSIGQTMSSLFAFDSTKATWYVTRSAGILAYLLLWFSTIWGLAIASKVFDRLLHRAYTFDFHEFISLLSIGFLGLHIVVLTADQYLPYSLAQILVPFASPYRPLWVGVGVIAFYLILLVTVTFYLRSKITMKTFRAIHLFSFIAYFGATVHGLMSGTDSSLPATMQMYAGTFLVFIFLTAYWFMTTRMQKGKLAKPVAAGQARRSTSSATAAARAVRPAR